MRKFMVGANDCVILWDDILEQAAAVLAAAGRGVSYSFRPHAAEFVGRAFSAANPWAEISAAVTAPWPEGMAVIEAMIAELGTMKLPRPEVVRPRRSWGEDGGSEIDLERYRDGKPYWATMQQRPRGGPRVITLLMDVCANANVPAEQILWRGATALVLAHLLEDAGYRAELVAYMYSRGAMESGRNLLQATWIKRPQERMDLGALVNAVSGWYFRTVMFGGIYEYPGEHPESGLGTAGAITPKLTACLANTQIVPWLVQGVWDLPQSVELARQLLAGLVPRGKVVVP